MSASGYIAKICGSLTSVPCSPGGDRDKGEWEL